MKELLANVLRQMFGGGEQNAAQPVAPLPTIQNAAKQVHAPTRQAYMQYVEECTMKGEQCLPYAQWVQQGAGGVR